MKHENLSMFRKNEYEGDFHWRDINVNNDLTILESQMLVRLIKNMLTDIIQYHNYKTKSNFVLINRVAPIFPKLQHVKF